MGETTPVRAAIYRRISDDSEGRELGVERQEADCRALADQHGYVVVGVYTDNDIGASTRSRKPRPDYQRMVADARAGRFEVILAYTSSRLTRRPREHEDLIELAEQHGTAYLYVRSPSVDLNTAAGRHVARMLAANDAAESEIMSERISRAMLGLVEQGRSLGGRRMFGFEPDGITVRESEARVVREAAEQVLAGVSLRQLALDLRRRQVPCGHGGQWSPTRLRELLLRPRNAGLVSYHGSILEDVPGPEPIVARSTWEAVRDLLTDQHRRTSPGTTPRWLGSGIYVCGHPVCAESQRPGRLTVGVNGRNQRSYRCEHGHLSRAATALDAYVVEHVTRRLAKPDAVSLVAPQHDRAHVDTLNLRAAELRTRIREAGDMWEEGEITRGELKQRRARLQSKLDDLTARLKQLTGTSAAADLAGRQNAAELWKELPLGQRRAILAELVTVTVLPSRKGRPPGYVAGSGQPYLDPDSVRIDWSDRDARDDR